MRVLLSCMRHFQLTLELLGKALLSRNLAFNESRASFDRSTEYGNILQLKLGGDIFFEKFLSL